MSKWVFDRSNSAVLILVIMLTSGGCLTSPFSHINSTQVPVEVQTMSAELAKSMPKVVWISETTCQADNHIKADSVVLTPDTLEGCDAVLRHVFPCDLIGFLAFAEAASTFSGA